MQSQEASHETPITSPTPQIVFASGSPIRDEGVRQDSPQVSTFRYRHLFEAMPQGVVFHDASGAITDANAAAQHMLGLSLDQLLQRTTLDPRWRALNEHGEEFPLDQYPAAVALNTGKHVTDTIMGIYNPVRETTRWISVNAVPEYESGEGGKPSGVFVTIEDITDRRLAEIARRNSEARLAGIIDSAVDAIITIDTRQAIRGFNPAAEKLFGYESDEILGLPLLLLLPERYRTGHDGFVREFIRSNVTSRDVESLGVLLARRKDGSEFPIDATISQVTIDGETLCTAIVRDVTEREKAAQALRESENRLRLTFEIGQFGSWESDLESGQVVAMSPVCREHLGLPPDIPLTRMQAFQQMHPDDRDRVRETVRESERSGDGTYIVEYRTIQPNGSIRHIKANGMPIRSEPHGPVRRVIGVTLDVTEERKREEELRRSEARLTDAQALAHVGSVEIDARTGERLWSDELFRICGLDPSDGPPDEASTRALYHPDDLPKRDKAIALLREMGQALKLDNRIIRPNGEIRWCHQEARAIYDNNGHLIRIVGVVADITERIESEERFRTLFENSQDAVLIVDFDAGFRILNCNLSALVLFGCRDKSELVGRRPMEFSPTFQPDGRVSDAPRPELEAILQQNKGTRFEWIHRTQDGIDVPTDVVLTRVQIGGQSVVLSVIRDLTERKIAEAALHESEYRQRLALAAGEFGVWDLDISTGEFLIVSDRVKALFGVPVQEEFTWIQCQSQMHPDDVSAVQERIIWAVVNRSAANVEYRVVHPDGTIRWLHSFGGPIVESLTPVRRLVGVTQDITDRKLLEAAREEALREAQERADHDPLTGLLNHRVFHHKLDSATERAAITGQPLALAILDLDNFKFFNEVYGYAVGDEVLQIVAQRLQEVCAGHTHSATSDAISVARFGGDEFAIVVTDPYCLNGDPLTAGSVEAYLQTELEKLDYIPPGSESAIPITVSVGAAVWLSETGQAAPDSRTLMEAAEERLRRAKTGAETEGAAQRVRATFGKRVEGFPMLDALVNSVDNKDRYTRRHSEDVLGYSVMIAEELGLDKATQETIAVAALLHDVGKIGIPDAVLRKPGRLTDDEFAAVRLHPVMGAVIVAAVPGLEATLDAIRHHHETWDGTGYPDRLKGEETPLIARLMAVADAFSAMTTSRPYRRNITRAEAIAILKKGAGTQWDAICVSAFLRALEARETQPLP